MYHLHLQGRKSAEQKWRVGLISDPKDGDTFVGASHGNLPHWFINGLHGAVSQTDFSEKRNNAYVVISNSFLRNKKRFS
jgi:hypothetical protein